jgi:nucleotide-binding universal stress UspA family protein
MKLTTVLVPLDGSTLAEAAVPVAVDLLGGRPGTTLVLVRAVDPRLPGVDDVGAQRDIVRSAEQYLREVTARLGGFGGTVKTSVWYGSPAASVVAAADAVGADMIVMTTHGRSGLGRLILGSVAEAVLRGTRRPLLLVRDTGAPVEPLAEAKTATQVSVG